MSKFRVCVTGGIASGKTYVSDRMADLGAFVIDADIVAREVVAPGSLGLLQIVKEFGAQVITDDGRLDRTKLKEMVFSNQTKLDKLNAILHPLIRVAMKDQSASSEDQFEVWVIPLFDEHSPISDFHRVLVIDLCEKIQLVRIQDRDSVSHTIAHNIVLSQPSRKARFRVATDVINNDGSMQQLEENIKNVFKLLVIMMQQQRC